VAPENLEMSERMWLRLILASEFSLMHVFLTTLLTLLPSILRSRAAVELENLALRHQIGVLGEVRYKTPEINLRRPPLGTTKCRCLCLPKPYRDRLAAESTTSRSVFCVGSRRQGM